MSLSPSNLLTPTWVPKSQRLTGGNRAVVAGVDSCFGLHSLWSIRVDYNCVKMNKPEYSCLIGSTSSPWRGAMTFNSNGTRYHFFSSKQKERT